MTTKQFLSHFPGLCLQTFDDSPKDKDIKLTTCGKPSSYPNGMLNTLNKNGAGIYFTPNSFPTGVRRAALCAGVNAWILENDNLSIEEQWKNLKASPLYPSFVVRSKNSLHAYWLALDGTIDNYQTIIRGLIKHFQGDEACKDVSRVFRIPGFYHKKDRENPFLIELVEENAKVYTEAEMLAAFPYVEEKKQGFIRVENKEDIWATLSSLDNKSVLERLSGQPIVNNEIITFAKRSVGEYILVDGDPCDGWLDDKGKIGSGKRGGPTWIQWLGYYGRSKADIVQWAKDNLIEVRDFEKGKFLRMPAIKQPKDYPLRYTWGTREMDIAFAIIKRTNFIVLAAKRSSGKTTLAFDMACKNAMLGHKVLFISLEMDEEDIKDDFGRKYAGITVEEELDYKIPEGKQIAYQKKIAEINSLSNLSIKGVRRGGGASWDSILEIISFHDELDLIYIDNLDLIEAIDKENDLDRQKRIVKNIMGFTSSRKIPIILIHHYRKSFGKDRGMDEMAGSGKIGDGADRVVKVTRNQKEGAPYPEKYRSTVYLQKGRGYPESFKEVYFIQGTFVDKAPPEIKYAEVKDLDDYYETVPVPDDTVQKTLDLFKT